MFFYNRKHKHSMRKGLFHSGCSKAEDLLPVETRIIPTGQPTSSESKKKSSLRSPENNIRVDYNKDIFIRYDYTRMQQNIALPFKTKTGVMVDDELMSSLKLMYEWCQKESSLASILSTSAVKSDKVMTISFNELMCHAIEGLLPDNSLLFQSKNEARHRLREDVPQIQSQTPYDVCVVNDSPIYAEISDTSIITELPIKGKNTPSIKCNHS